MRWRLAEVALLVPLAAALPGVQPATPLAQAFEAYVGGDYEAVDRMVPAGWFEDGRQIRTSVEETLQQVPPERQLACAAFLLEVARYGLSLQSPEAMWVLDQARRLVITRPDLPGQNAAEDAFELAWHKAAVALLGGLRAPDVLEDRAVAPARTRVGALPADDGPSRIVDPWIELAHATVAEQRALANPHSFAQHAREAVRRFEEAAKYGPNTYEATVRMAGLLTRLGKPDEALAALDRLGPLNSDADATLRYWGLLFRGRALEGLGRLDEASAALQEALDLFPGAQTPAAALAALEARRGRPDAARDWALKPRPLAGGDTDPWVRYGSGDYRLYPERIEQLRAMIR